MFEIVLYHIHIWHLSIYFLIYKLVKIALFLNNYLFKSTSIYLYLYFYYIRTYVFMFVYLNLNQYLYSYLCLYLNLE